MSEREFFRNSASVDTRIRGITPQVGAAQTREVA
jgi:hypothetical protein